VTLITIVNLIIFVTYLLTYLRVQIAAIQTDSTATASNYCPGVAIH